MGEGATRPARVFGKLTWSMPLSPATTPSRPCEGFLAAHGLGDGVGAVVGRTTADPALLKPSPHLVRLAIDAMGADPADCTMIGDSVSDIESARAAGARSIGYANRPGKDRRLAEAGADGIITTLADLLG